MSSGSDYLDEVVERLKSGGKRPWRRGDNLLAAFGYVRRRQTVIDTINRELESKGLRTEPPITTSFPLDKSVKFYLAKEEGEGRSLEDGGELEDGEDAEEIEPSVYVPVIVGNIRSAGEAPQTIAPEACIEEAITNMELHQYSQLVVKGEGGKAEGVVSFRSIARGQLSGVANTVADCIDATVPTVNIDDELMSILHHFQDHDVAIVRDSEESLCGLLTLADLAAEFRRMIEPFLLIGEVESRLRWLLQQRKVDFNAVLEKSPAMTTGKEKKIDQLGLGDIQRVIQNRTTWKALGVPYHRKTVNATLNDVRNVRNDVMHFREPAGREATDLLRNFRSLLGRMCEAVE